MSAPSLIELESLVTTLLGPSPLLAFHASASFQVLYELGRGGMGQVLAVQDRRANRRAALKILTQEQPDAAARERFLREARLTAGLDHPSIPPVFEMGETARGELFMLMRLIDGQTLTAEIAAAHKEGLSASSERRLLQIFLRLAEALAYAHSRGIIHRDLKPDNVMVGGFGEVLLMDWGVALDLNKARSMRGAARQGAESAIRESGDELAATQRFGMNSDELLTQLTSSALQSEGLTLAGTAVGTPGYMAPEQADGARLDSRADVYALGLVLGEILRGERLVDAQGLIPRLRANLEGRWAHPIEWQNKISPVLTWILEQALQFDVAARTESVGLLKEQVEAYLAGDWVPGYQAGAFERAQFWLRRHSQRLIAALLALLFGLLGLALFLTTRDLARGRRELLSAARRAEDERALRARADRIIELFNQARDRARRQQRAEAKELCEKALQLSERSEPSLLLAAEIAQQVDDRARAIELYREAAKNFSPAWSALYELAEYEMEDGLTLSDSLREILNRAQQQGLEHEIARLAQAVELYLNGRIEDSLSRVSAALAQNDGLVLAWTLRAELFLRAGRLDEARSDLDRAVFLRPRSDRIIGNRARVSLRLGELDAALTDWERVIQIAPTSISALLGSANIMAEQGRTKEAQARSNRALEIDGKNVRALNSRAVFRIGLGDRRGALDDLNRALSAGPDDPSALSNRGLLLLQDGQVEAARRDLTKAAELGEGNPTVFLNRGYYFEVLEKWNEAIADYDRALMIDPGFYKAIIAKAGVYSSRREFPRARAVLDEAIHGGLRRAELYINRGLIAQAASELSEAHADFDRAIELNPRLALGWHNRALVRAATQRLDEALADFTSPSRSTRNMEKAGLAEAEFNENWSESPRPSLIFRRPSSSSRRSQTPTSSGPRSASRSVT